MYREGVMAEIIVVFLLVMNQIWNWPQYPWLITLPLGIVIASWILRKDSFRTLGLNPEPMPKDLLEFLICFFIFSFLVILAGISYLSRISRLNISEIEITGNKIVETKAILKK